jgi:hypothetical protein
MKVHKLPGYTGFQPYKGDCIGLTTGAANRHSESTFNATKTGGNSLNLTANDIMIGKGKYGDSTGPKSPRAMAYYKTQK